MLHAVPQDGVSCLFDSLTDLVPYGVAASVLCFRAEGHTADQLGARQHRDAVVVDGQHTQLVVPRRGQVAQQKVLVVGWNHPETQSDKRRRFSFAFLSSFSGRSRFKRLSSFHRWHV